MSIRAYKCGAEHHVDSGWLVAIPSFFRTARLCSDCTYSLLPSLRPERQVLGHVEFRIGRHFSGKLCALPLLPASLLNRSCSIMDEQDVLALLFCGSLSTAPHFPTPWCSVGFASNGVSLAVFPIPGPSFAGLCL